MAKEKKAPAMEIKKLNLTQDIRALQLDIAQETNLMVLNHAIDQESNTGNREPVISALTLRAASLAPRSHGPGSESTNDPFADDLKWDTYDRSQPMTLKEHNFGDGSIGKQNLTEEQRILGQFKIKESEHRTKDVNKLTTPIKKHPNGVVDYPWGSIFPNREEVVVNGKVALSKMANRIYLRNCPKCGRVNKPDAGVTGSCATCYFNAADNLVKPCIDLFKKDFPDLWLDANL